jgi:hypothetical protein
MEKSVFVMPLFPGWYSSILDSQLDWEIERDSEYYANESESNLQYPEKIRATELQICDSYYGVDFSDYRQAVNAQWLETLAECIRDETLDPERYADDIESMGQDEKFGLALYALADSMAVESMTSPRYYNFETDRLFVYGNSKAFAAMLALARNEHNRDAWQKMIRERHSSRSGFISHYANTDSEWPESIDDFDHNHLATLFLFALQQADRWDSADQLVEQVTESLLYDENRAFYDHVQIGDSALAEIHAENLTEWLESDMCEYEGDESESPALKWLYANLDSPAVIKARESDADLISKAMRVYGETLAGITPRCNETPDMF